MYRPIVALLLLLTAFGSTACSKRQLGPTILAGGGAALMVSGVAYRASFHDEEDAGMLGRTAEQKAVTSTLLFSGLALILAGVIWSATTPVCEADGDCWIGDVCERATRTCVPAPATATSTAGRTGAWQPPLPAPALSLPTFDAERFNLRDGPPALRASRWQLAAR